MGSENKDVAAPWFGGVAPVQASAPLPEDVTTTWDEAHAAGYWGVKMDPYPNTVYTVEGADPMMAATKRGPGRPRKDE